MKVLIQNLQKRSGLATDLLNEHDPDVMLAQEISITYERNHYDDKYYAHNTSSLGYGTAIYSKGHDIRKVKLVEAPCSEFVGTIRKKTTIATCTSHYIQFVSLHGYNGTPFRTTSTAKLVAHVQLCWMFLTQSVLRSWPEISTRGLRIIWMPSSPSWNTKAIHFVWCILGRILDERFP